MPFNVLFNQLLETYSSLGYPPEVIQQWTLPECDAETIITRLMEKKPLRILEVGTFVGFTTLLMALRSPDTAIIYSVDPNLPLDIEMSSMKSNAYDSDLTMRSQDLARKAAGELGVAHKIEFHSGGFSTGDTFSSTIVQASHKVPVVGTELCEKHGPFDFILIDGLHYEHAVLSDLALASRHLAPQGIIAVHDITGRWGSNVRRAVFRFLDQNNDFVFYHEPYSEKCSAVAFLQYHSDIKSSYSVRDVGGGEPG